MDFQYRGYRNIDHKPDAGHAIRHTEATILTVLAGWYNRSACRL